MQGQVLNAAATSNQGVILGDDQIHYTFTQTGWRDHSLKARAGMRVSFEVSGDHAVGVYPERGAVQPSATAHNSARPFPQSGNVNPSASQPAYPQAPLQAATPTPATRNVPQTIYAASEEPTSQHSAGQRYQSIRKLDIEGIISSLLVMCLGSLLTVIFFPIIGAIIDLSLGESETVGTIAALVMIFPIMIGAIAIGLYGGRIAGGLLNAAVAGLLAALIMAVVNFIMAQIVVDYIRVMPFIGDLLDNSQVGQLLTEGTILLSLLTAFPLFLSSALGGAIRNRKMRG